MRIAINLGLTVLERAAVLPTKSSSVEQPSSCRVKYIFALCTLSPHFVCNLMDSVKLRIEWELRDTALECLICLPTICTDETVQGLGQRFGSFTMHKGIIGVDASQEFIHFLGANSLRLKTQMGSLEMKLNEIIGYKLYSPSQGYFIMSRE